MADTNHCLTEKQTEHKKANCCKTLYCRCDRKLMSMYFLLTSFFWFNVGAVTHPWSSFSPFLCINGKLINTGHCDMTFKLKSLKHLCLSSPSDPLCPVSFIHRYNWVTVVQSGVWMWCVPLRRGQGEWKVSPGWRTTTHIVAFYFLWKAHRRQCSLRHDACKELWHRVISAGHSPSADVGKESHSCRWRRLLCNSTRATVPCPADFPLTWIFNYLNATFFGLLIALINGSESH